MPSDLRLIPAQDYRRERWRNGMGWTREIVRVPDVENWDWRLSIAEIENDAAFSSFPGIDRELVLLRGNGLRLRFEDDGSERDGHGQNGAGRNVHERSAPQRGEHVELGPPHGRYRFSGERKVHGELIDGTTHDFNLMWRRDRIDAQLWHRPLVGSIVVFVEPGESWAAYLLAGRASCRSADAATELSAGDTLLMQSIDARGRYAIDGGGELLLIRLRVRES